MADSPPEVAHPALDADIRASFDRKSRTNITYQSGSIEDGAINAQVVDVLEGTKPVFDNRSGKYR